MKRIRLHLILAGLCMVWQTSLVIGQITPPGSADATMATFGSNMNVQITNTAVMDIPVGGLDQLQVIVWDGANPSFGWDRIGMVGTSPIAGSSLGVVEQPDIVLDPSASAGNEKALIVYLLNDQLYYEIHQWNGLNFSLISGPNAIAGTLGATHPNVDVAKDGNAVIVWSLLGNVYAKGIKLPTNTLSNYTFDVNSCIAPTKYCDRSDVAGWFGTDKTSAIFNFVFVGRSTGGNHEVVIVQRALWWKIWIGGAAGCTNNWSTVIEDAHPAFGCGTPRVACPSYYFTSSFNRRDLSIVCTVDNGAGVTEVINYTHHAASYPIYHLEKNVVNTVSTGGLGNFTSCANSSPAISYVGKDIKVVWALNDCFGNFSNSDDIVSRQLNADGTSTFQAYSAVNFNLAGNQVSPSIDGKLTESLKAYFGWYDEDLLSINYRQTASSGLVLRKSTVNSLSAGTENEAKGFKAFPNPMSSNSIFSIDLFDGEMVESLQIYDLSGRVIDQLAIEGISTNAFQMEWQPSPTVPSGVYLVRLVSNQRSESVRITKQ